MFDGDVARYYLLLAAVGLSLVAAGAAATALASPWEGELHRLAVAAAGCRSGEVELRSSAAGGRRTVRAEGKGKRFCVRPVKPPSEDVARAVRDFGTRMRSLAAKHPRLRKAVQFRGMRQLWNRKRLNSLGKIAKRAEKKLAEQAWSAGRARAAETRQESVGANLGDGVSATGTVTEERRSGEAGNSVTMDVALTHDGDKASDPKSKGTEASFGMGWQEAEFVSKCPTAAGLVTGEWKHAFRVGASASAGGKRMKTSGVSAATVKFKAQVGDDGRVKNYTMTADVVTEMVTHEHDAKTGKQTNFAHPVYRGAFSLAGIDPRTPVPDMTGEQMISELGRGGFRAFGPKGAWSGTDVTGLWGELIGWSALALLSIPDINKMLLTAEEAWLEVGRCSEIRLDPTGLPAMGLGETISVRVEVVAKDGDVAPATIAASAELGAITPRVANSAPGSPATYTYTAPQESWGDNSPNLIFIAASRAGSTAGTLSLPPYQDPCAAQQGNRARASQAGDGGQCKPPPAIPASYDLAYAGQAYEEDDTSRCDPEEGGGGILEAQWNLAGTVTRGDPDMPVLTGNLQSSYTTWDQQVNDGARQTETQSGPFDYEITVTFRDDGSIDAAVQPPEGLDGRAWSAHLGPEGGGFPVDGSETTEGQGASNGCYSNYSNSGTVTITPRK